ncbi:MAG: PEP-CTERM sorting domain-containing protein [Armatimonadetes bacterium]|nr:PEP-CTERM sorting domain-containing protein [Armatimonadota bacterium]
MQRNQGWVKSLTIAACILTMTGVSHAQTATLTSATVTGLAAFTQSGTPSFTTSIVGSPAGVFGVPSLVGFGSSTVVNFPTNFQFNIANAAGTSTGTNDVTLAFDINGVTVTGIVVPVSYSVTTISVAFTGATIPFTAGDKNFSFRFSGNNSVPATGSAQNVNLPGVLTLVSASAAPEPGTLALFGLGVAPIAVAIRRRRK